MTKIKICGLYRACDVEYVNRARPDWCGFVINFPKSHRSVTAQWARELRAGLSRCVRPVGVFVDRPPEEVAALLNDGTLAVAQLHGHEDADYIARLRAMAPGIFSGVSPPASRNGRLTPPASDQSKVCPVP